MSPSSRMLRKCGRIIFFGPIYALINLFIYILQNPQHPHIQSDLTVMEIGAGYFARLQFVTDSEVCIRFAKEMADLAYEACAKANQNDSTGDNSYEHPTNTPRELHETTDRLPDPSQLDHFWHDTDMITVSLCTAVIYSVRLVSSFSSVPGACAEKDTLLLDLNSDGVVGRNK